MSMKDAPIFFCLCITGSLLLSVSSCTSYIPTKLQANRMADTLALALTGPGAARWEPAKDSLVIECPSCDPTRVVENFANSTQADYEIPATESLTLLLYSMGTVDTVSLPGAASQAATTPKPRLLPRRYHAATAPSIPKTPEETKAEQTKAEQAKAAERALKTTTLLKVTATEGVAVYKDKTKREVLKILPQGSTLILLAKEGDLYSVSIDGDEGFVDAEAVQIQQ